MEDFQFIMRAEEILKDCDAGRITDSQAIKKLMRSHTKLIQTRLKDEIKVEKEFKK